MPFNRTIVELKSQLQAISNHSAVTFNRTIVELKSHKMLYSMGQSYSFNRTIVELKSQQQQAMAKGKQLLTEP